jgi:hypothetical protein
MDSQTTHHMYLLNSPGDEGIVAVKHLVNSLLAHFNNSSL